MTTTSLHKISRRSTSTAAGRGLWFLFDVSYILCWAYVQPVVRFAHKPKVNDNDEELRSITFGLVGSFSWSLADGQVEEQTLTSTLASTSLLAFCVDVNVTAQHCCVCVWRELTEICESNVYLTGVLLAFLSVFYHIVVIVVSLSRLYCRCCSCCCCCSWCCLHWSAYKRSLSVCCFFFRSLIRFLGFAFKVLSFVRSLALFARLFADVVRTLVVQVLGQNWAVVFLVFSVVVVFCFCCCVAWTQVCKLFVCFFFFVVIAAAALAIFNAAAPHSGIWGSEMSWVEFGCCLARVPSNFCVK